MMLLVSLLAAGIPLGLTTERLPDPVGIDAARPRLSWQAPEGVVRQTAYEIEADGRSCGRIAGTEQIDVPWPGETPTTGSRHVWRVRLWDERGQATDWSSPASFVSG